jgi:hypothetical protein
MTCQFTFGGLRKKTLTVKGSGCVALGHPVTSAKNWLLEEDDRSKADVGFGTAPALLSRQPLAKRPMVAAGGSAMKAETNKRRRYPRIFEDSRNLERHA